MTAYLDKQRNHGDRSGGVSDPRMIRQVDTLIASPVTQEQIMTIKSQITAHSPDQRTEQMLTAMIFPDTTWEVA